MKKIEFLKEGYLYKTKDDTIVIFKYVGSKGNPIFMFSGEPSFQDCFFFQSGWQNEIVEELRPATKQELEGHE